jgi:hypothetical protein
VLSLPGSHFIFLFLYHQKSIIAISTPVSSPSHRQTLEKERRNCHGKNVRRHRRAEHERPSWCGVTSSAWRTTLLPDLPRSLLHHRLLDDVPDEHAQDTQLPGMFCSGSWPLTSSLARKRPSSSWVALSRAPNTSVPLATCTRDGQRLTHDCVGKDLALFPMRRGTNHHCPAFLDRTSPTGSRESLPPRKP